MKMTTEKFAIFIKEERTRMGMTQTELAERCGIAQSNVARIEGGKYSPGLDLLETIAEAMGKKVDIV